MKKILFLAPMALALAACSEKDIVEQGNTGGYNDFEHSFLSVSIIPANASATRTVPDGDDYRDGTGDENYVKSIRFYFFDKDGKAAPVKADGASFYDVQEDEIQQEQYEGELQDGPVEKIVSAIVVIESPKGDGKPAYMAAVLNHNGNAPTTIENIEDLQKKVGDYSQHGEGQFTMSSTVYKGNKVIYELDPKDDKGQDLIELEDEKANQEIVAVPVYKYITSTRQEAIRNPATIYVERVLAKVSAFVNITEESHPDGVVSLGDEKLYKVGYVGNQGLMEEPADAKGIYVKFLGWNVTGTRKESRLVKDIVTDWTFGKLDTENPWRIIDWNDPTNKRSYWAINPEITGSNPIDNNFNFFEFATETGTGVWGPDEKGNQAWSFVFGNSTQGKNYTYLQENAGASSDGMQPEIYNSKVIVAAQLVDESGNPLELIEWQSDIYDYGNNKDEVLDAMAADTDLYILEGTTWRRIKGSDVEIVFTNAEDADEAYDRNKEGERRYYVYLKLKNTTAKYGKWKYNEDSDSWGLDNNNGVGYDYDDDDVDGLVKQALLNIGYIKHWNTGYTYYWVDIKHFGEKDTTGEKDITGEYGVVRNHWYEYTFTDVKGLGIPVSNPNEIIYPEEPGDPDYFFLAAEVKILSWRMVHNDNTSLGW